MDGGQREHAEKIGEIGKAAAGHAMNICVRVEIGSDGKRPPNDVVTKLNAKLAEVSKKLKLE